MTRKNNRGLQFDGKKLAHFIRIKKAELDMTNTQFEKFIGFSLGTLYSCVFYQSMEKTTYQKLEKKFKNDVRFLKVFSKNKIDNEDTILDK